MTNFDEANVKLQGPDVIGSDKNSGSVNSGHKDKKTKPGQLKISTRLIAGFISMPLCSILIGGAGIYFVSEINNKINEVTEVASPTAAGVSELSNLVLDGTKVAEEIIADEEVADIAHLTDEFSNISTRFHENYDALMKIVTKPELISELEHVEKSYMEFDSIAKKMFNAHELELAKELEAKDLLEKFDGGGSNLIERLEEFAIENEAEMALAEEKGDELEKLNASGAEVNKVLGQLFDQDYPVVEAALKLQRIAMEMQDTAGEYLAEETIENLRIVDENFSDLYNSAYAHIKVLNNLAETDEDKKDAEAIELLFGQWIDSAQGEGMLFSTHENMLIEEVKADNLIEELEKIGDKIELSLDMVKEVAGQISTNADQDAADATKSALIVTLVLLISAIILSAILVFVVIFKVVNPINAMTKAMTKLSFGDNDTSVPSLENTDEIGEIARALQIFKENNIEKEKLSEKAKEQTAAREKRTKKIEELIGKFENSSDQVLKTVAEAASHMQDNATSLSDTADSTNEQSTAVAAASEQATVNVQTVASATEELSCSIGEINQQINQSSQVARLASEEADHTGNTMRELSLASQKIGDVVSLITDIAEQTNLLALNATIEAARAGEAGKGFSVVASEVKSLASQTAKATEEIGRHISEISTISGEAVSATERISKTISEMNEIATAISAAMEEQRAATEEISRNVSEAASGTTEVNTNISKVNQGAQMTGKAANEVLDAANELSNQVGSMSENVEHFLTGIRAS